MASGVPITLNAGVMERINESDTLYAGTIKPASGGSNLTIKAGSSSDTIYIGETSGEVNIPGNLTVVGTELVQGTTTFTGDVNLGDGSDTIAIGNDNTDTVNLNTDLDVAAGIMINLATSGGHINLPNETQATATDGSDGYLRLNVSGTDVLEYLDLGGTTWTAVGTTAANTLQETYAQGSTISTTAGGSDLQFTVTTNGDFDILNGTDSFGFNYAAVNQLGIAGVVQTFDIDAAGAVTLDGGATSNFSTSTGDIDISAAAELDLDGGTSVAIDSGTTMALTATTTLDLDAAGIVSINSSAAAINIGNDAVAQGINIGTGAAARTIAIGNTTGATAVTLDAGSGGISLDTAVASNFTVSGATADLTLGARGATITLNELGETSLDGGFTATSIIGAINELSDDIGAIAGNTLDSAYDQGGAGSGRIITADSGAVEINGANAADYGLEVTNSGNGGALFVNSTGTGNVVDLQDGGSNVLQIADGGAFDIDSAAFDLDASGAVSIDSTSTIDIGANTAAGDMNLGTNATARTISIGNTTGATAVNIDAGTGGISFDTAGASNFTVSGATADLTLGARGATVTLNESGQTSLSGFTATSLIGSLNELKAEVDEVGAWTAAADVVLAAGDLVCVDNNAVAGVLGKADADSATGTQRHCVGAIVTGAAAGSDVEVQSVGRVSVKSNASEQWANGARVFLDTNAGMATLTVPTTGVRQSLGWAIGDGSAGTTHDIVMVLNEVVVL